MMERDKHVAPESAFSNIPSQVVVKFTKGSVTPQQGGASSLKESTLAEIRRAAPEAEIAPYFSQGETRSASIDPFNRYFAIEVPDEQAGALLTTKLLAIEIIESAYVAGIPVLATVAPDDDPRSKRQSYLNPAPDGIDARWAWQVSDGAGVGFVDVEYGWRLDHEDLVDKGITLISGINDSYQGHGTCVVGQVVASDNLKWGIGIAPAAACRVASIKRSVNRVNSAEAILSAVDVMQPGDVLLITVGDPSGYPLETSNADFDAIRHAVASGIVVVESAGNHGFNLNAYQDVRGRRTYNRNDIDFRDSGAIIVGAATAIPPHERLDLSNFGVRIDCYGWGQLIATIGTNGLNPGDNGTPTSFTLNFGGTSGAAPIVAGAAILLQSWLKKNNKPILSPYAMRAVLSAPFNTPSADPDNDQIGVMPDMKAIVISQQLAPVQDNYVSLIHILVGLIDDSPGLAWVPGRRPVPVDPGWGPLIKPIAAPKRDLLTALAINELAERLDDADVRAKVSEAASEAMRIAVERISHVNR